MTRRHKFQPDPVPNPERVRADQERRRSGAAGAHDPRPNRERSRLDAERAAIRDQER